MAKDAERAEAVAIAKGITAANEKAGTPAAALDGILTGALKPRFGWIQGFDTPLVAPGHWRVIMRTPIDEEYKPGRRVQKQFFEPGDTVWGKSGGKRFPYKIETVFHDARDGSEFYLLSGGTRPLLYYPDAPKPLIEEPHEVFFRMRENMYRNELASGAMSQAKYERLFAEAYRAFSATESPTNWAAFLQGLKRTYGRN